MRDMKSLLSQLFPHNLPSMDDLEKRFPSRELPEGAHVTRIAPSPTGFMHIGTLYVGLISEMLAHQSGGVFFIRIEDTDKQREVEGAGDFIISSFHEYGIDFDEGKQLDGGQKGEYGPYVQSERADYYYAAVRHLYEQKKAYPCFCTSEELDEMRKKQEQTKVPMGYYGKWAICRELSEEDIQSRLESGSSYVMRFKSHGDAEKRVKIYDKILGERELPENVQDVIIMKSSGLPTYHMAHIVDDHFMRTTLVTRGGEWLPSLPIHIQLFDAFGWKLPKYAHIMPINKLDGSSRRKLSKRKDPESNVSFFQEKGYPKQAILEYLLNLANSAFEPWRQQKPDAPLDEFQLTFKGLQNSSGPLFDFVKLDDIAKDILAKKTADELYDELLIWCKKYDMQFAEKIENNAVYTKNILSIERGGKKARKDNATYAELRRDIAYFYDDEFMVKKEDVLSTVHPVTEDQAHAVIEEYLKVLDFAVDKDQWFESVKMVAEKHGFAVNMKEFKANPDDFVGNVSDMVKIFRVLLTGREHTPDLYSIMHVMGKERVTKRLQLDPK